MHYAIILFDKRNSVVTADIIVCLLVRKTESLGKFIHQRDNIFKYVADCAGHNAIHF